jgi:hypothetical protein
MTTADYEGIVRSVAAPRYDRSDGQPYFVFSIPQPKYPPQPPPTAPVFYVALNNNPFAKLITSLVFTAYITGADLQVGVVPKSMDVAWVQLPRSPGGVSLFGP